MLQNMRESFTGKFALGLLAMIGLSFVFFGLNYSFVGSQYAAKVDGEKIDAQVFEQSYREALQRQPELASVGGDLRIQIRRSLLDQLITRQLIDNFLDEQGYRITDEQVVEFVQNTPEFQKDGKFDRDTYRNFLAERGLVPIRFEQLQRDALREQQLQLAIGATALVTPAEYRRYLNLMAEQRIVSVASLDEESVGSEIEVTDEMVEAWYDNNPSLYQLPESVDIQYIEITRDEVAAQIAVDEADLKAYYDENRDRYQQDEQRHARHILIVSGDDEAAAEEKANTVLARLKAGESFEELAAEVSDDTGTAEQGGDLGTLTRTQLGGELGSTIFSMSEGEIAGPVKSEFGFHIVKLDEILARGPLPLDQVRGELLTELRQREAEDRFRDLERALSDALFDSSDIEAIATETGLSIESAMGITRSSGGPFGSNQVAIDTIFSASVLDDGQISEVVELDANRSAIFKVVTHHEATRQPLADVHEQIVADLRSEQAKTLMTSRAEQMLEALAGGADFADAAETAGLSVDEPQMLTRTNPDVDQALMFEVFAAGKPTEDRPVSGRVQLQDGNYAVYKLDAVLPGRPESIPLAERDQGKLMLAQQSGVDDFQAFLQELRNDAKIVVNDGVVAAEDLFQ